MDCKNGSDALKAIIRQYPEALNKRSLLKALLLDFLPNERLLQNTVLMVFDEGIHSAMQGKKSVEEFDLLRYIKQLKAGYGINDETARDALQIWGDSLGVTIVFEKPGKPDGARTPSSEAAKKEVVWKDSADVGDYEFEEMAGGLRITKFIGFDEPVIAIPNMINGKKVLSIGNYAFRGCRSIAGIVVPEGVTEIGNGAFKDMYGLKRVSLPETLKRIGSTDTTGLNPKRSFGAPRIEGAFENSGIERIVIPDSVTFLGERSFYSCRSMSEIKLSNSLQAMQQSTFSHSIITCIDLPPMVEVIGEDAFIWCSRLQSVSMPGARVIGERAFSFCGALQSVSLPGVEVIGESAFSYCSALQSVSLPYGAKRIESRAFGDCDKLSKIVIPSTVEYIDRVAFVSLHGALTIYCDAGSYAMKYAREHNIKCAKIINK